MNNVLYLLSRDCPNLRFISKFADVLALMDGNTELLRPDIDAMTRKRLDSLPPPGKEVALVIGGNGFIGAHLVARLSQESSIRRVFATVRAIAEHTPEQRLEHTWSRYQITQVDRSKITLIEATPTQSMLGLGRKSYRQLTETIDLVFNCASSTDYSASYLELREDWVISLLRVLQFCMEGQRKHVTYLGSVGSYFYRTPLDFQRSDSWWYSGYCQMKWVNGQLIRWLWRDRVLSCTLCETPYVFGSTQIGLDPGLHYSWWRIVEIAKSIGLLWNGQGMNYVPVDILVDTLVTNAMLAQPLPHVLPCNPQPYDNQMLAALLDLRLVDWDDFAAEAARTISPLRLKTVLCENIRELVHLSNQAAVFPEKSDPSWCNHEQLYSLYLSHLKFRDVRSRPFQEVTLLKRG